MPGEGNKITSANQNNNQENNTIIENNTSPNATESNPNHINSEGDIPNNNIINDSGDLDFESNLNINEEIKKNDELNQLQKETEILTDYNGENPDNFLGKFLKWKNKNQTALDLQKKLEQEQKELPNKIKNAEIQKRDKNRQKYEEAKDRIQKQQDDFNKLVTEKILPESKFESREKYSNPVGHAVNNVSLNFISKSEMDAYNEITKTMQNADQQFRITLLDSIYPMLEDDNTPLTNIADWIDAYLLTCNDGMKFDDTNNFSNIVANTSNNKDLNKAKAIVFEYSKLNTCIQSFNKKYETEYKQKRERTIKELNQISLSINSFSTSWVQHKNNYNREVRRLHQTINELNQINNKRQTIKCRDMMYFLTLTKHLLSSYEAERDRQDRVEYKDIIDNIYKDRIINLLNKTQQYVYKYLEHAHSKKFWKMLPGSTGARRLAAASQLEDILSTITTEFSACLQKQAKLNKYTTEKLHHKEMLDQIENIRKKNTERYVSLQTQSNKLAQLQSNIKKILDVKSKTELSQFKECIKNDSELLFSKSAHTSAASDNTASLTGTVKRKDTIKAEHL